jgi:serine/threonine protein kinase
MIGKVIHDEYRVDRILGEGSFGVVYECTDVNLGRPVALKMLHADAIQDKGLRRFKNEGRSMASINHPNVVQVYRLGEHEEQPYIVMELVEGRTLRRLLRDSQLSIASAVDVMSQAARGLAAIHSAGLVHRDLSTNNVMVTEDGTAKILDLGLAHFVDAANTRSQQYYIAGTVLYVAPEVIQGGGATVASDVFSFGAILYEAITGLNPFSAEHPTSIIYNITNRTPPPLSTYVQEVPDDLGDLTSECLRRRPESRPTDLNDVARRLTEIGDLALSTRVVPSEGPAARPSSSMRNPYLNRVMIKRYQDFFGRTREVKRIYSRLNATPPGSISIVGDRRIGKSSLLNYIYTKRNREQYLERPESTIMVFMDLQEETDMTLPRFAQKLTTLAQYEIQDRVAVPDATGSLDGIRELLQRLEEEEYRLVVLFDEFEVITTNENFTLEFFSFLRFLANHYDVVYLTSSAKDLQVLCHTKEISDSPFFNIFSTMRLSAFDREEADRLIVEPARRVGHDLRSHADWIRQELSGLFPFFIQVACSHVIECAEETGPDREIDFEQIRRRFCVEAQPHYRYMWEGFEEQERAVITQVVRGRAVPESLQHVLKELDAKRCVMSSEDGVRIFSKTFEDFVRERVGNTGAQSLWSRIFSRRGDAV